MKPETDTVKKIKERERKGEKGKKVREKGACLFHKVKLDKEGYYYVAMHSYLFYKTSPKACQETVNNNHIHLFRNTGRRSLFHSNSK